MVCSMQPQSEEGNCHLQMFVKRLLCSKVVIELHQQNFMLMQLAMVMFLLFLMSIVFILTISLVD